VGEVYSALELRLTHVLIIKEADQGKGSAQTYFQKILSAYGAVPVRIKLIYHRLDFLGWYPFTKLFCHASYVFSREIAFLVVVEEFERPEDFLFRIFVCDFRRDLPNVG
jgi:hypothetical protein